MEGEEASPSAPTLNVRDQSLGMKLTFEAPAYVDAQRIASLLKDELPVVKRFLDDPINAPAIGRKAGPQRNEFLALLLSIDRVGGADFSVLPLVEVCNPALHGGETPGGRCPLCSVLHVLSAAQQEKLIRITSISGRKDERGRYTFADKITLAPGAEFDGYREKVKRLPLPPLLMSAAPSSEDGAGSGAVRKQLAALPAGTWDKLTIEVLADSFKVSGVSGYPSDLGLAQHEWSMLCDFAKGQGRYAPQLLGQAAMQVAKNVERLNAALKKAFPQIPGDPIRKARARGYEAAFHTHSGDKLLGGTGW